MIIIVAPYSPVSLSRDPHLGAARKIEMVVEALAVLDSEIILVNSAHNEVNAKANIENLEVGGVRVKHVIPPTYSNKKMGKLLNLKDINKTVSACMAFGQLKMVWIYNSYAFENLFSMVIKKKADVPVVLEFEDWHFSRSRGLNPKPYIDNLFWKCNLKNIEFSFGVNDKLANIMSGYGVESALLPGVVPANLIKLCDQETAFSDEVIKVGYFGGLTEEKGVDVLIDAIDKSPEGYKFFVSGAGILEKDLVLLSNKYPLKLDFHGRITEKKLYELIASVDVIINPHSPINDMSQGVFPFKVVEAVASGKLLITTELPAANVPGLLEGAVFYDGSAKGLVECITQSRYLHKRLRGKIHSSTLVARERFSINALLAPIKKLMNNQEET